MEINNILKMNRVLLLLVLTTLATHSFPQVGSKVQMQDVDVRQLSDGQINQIADEISSRGLTEQQWQLLAQSRGMSSAQIALLKERLYQLQSSNVEDVREYGVLREEVTQNNVQSNDIFGAILKVEEEKKDNIFGQNFFSNPNLTFEPSLNVPTPVGYVLGPGDEILVSVWGASEQTYSLTINPEGFVVIPNLGPVHLTGLDINSASEKLRYKLKRIYSGLGSNTFAEISLGKIRSIKVNVVGEVERPGTYTLSSFSSPLNALYHAGGPNQRGSLRKIDIIRNGKLHRSIDFYEFLLGTGYQLGTLHDQDIVIVRPYEGRVKISGEVKRPGVYEVLDEQTLTGIMSLAGGFSDMAVKTSVTIYRVEGMYRSVSSVEKEDFDSFQLQGGDEIHVSRVTDMFINRVQIDGAVQKPGDYELTDGLTLKDLIKRAHGLRGDAFLGRGLIVRLNENYTFSNISFNLTEVLNGNENYLLKNNDQVLIRSIFDLKEDYFISVQGQVNNPGEYPFVSGMTVEDLIFLANGFKESAAKSFVEVARRLMDNETQIGKSSQIFTFPIDENLNISESASKFQLEPFDLIVIRKSPTYSSQKIVEVEGEVNFPGKYTLEKKNERISDLLERCGGITQFGYVKGATLIRRTEYFEGKRQDLEAVQIRIDNLKQIVNRDSTLGKSNIILPQQESIGIDLEAIIKNPGSKHDMILLEGDILSIPKKLETIRLRGEVLYPSTVRYENTLSFKQYVSLAGGFTEEAKKAKTYLIYPNGKVNKTKNFLWFKDYPKVAPGAEIIIPRKPERRRLTTQEVISIASGIGTLSLIINNLIR